MATTILRRLSLGFVKVHMKPGLLDEIKREFAARQPRT